MIVDVPICLMCKHFKKDPRTHWFSCTAFPEGIPNEIVYGRADHRKKYPGDNGIRFEEKTSNAEELNERLEKSVVPYFEDMIKHWAEWSKFRKPVYQPHNKKSVSACRKYANMGVMGPGCARTMKLAEDLYEKGKDDNDYVPPETVDPEKLFSNIREERKKEEEKRQAVDKMDQVFDQAYFYRNPLGNVIILNWASLPTDYKQILSNMFDENGRLKDSKQREFDKRFKDYNVRRKKRGLDEKRIA